jgi:hypothetical protein
MKKPKVKKFRGVWKNPKGQAVDFDILDYALITTSEYDTLLSFREEYWRLVHTLRRLIPDKPSF